MFGCNILDMAIIQGGPVLFLLCTNGLRHLLGGLGLCRAPAKWQTCELTCVMLDVS